MAIRSIPTASIPTATSSVASRQSPHLVWHGTPSTLNECRLACALAIHVCFEDKTLLDHITIGRVIGATSICEQWTKHCSSLKEGRAFQVAAGTNTKLYRQRRKYT